MATMTCFLYVFLAKNDMWETLVIFCKFRVGVNGKKKKIHVTSICVLANNDIWKTLFIVCMLHGEGNNVHVASIVCKRQNYVGKGPHTSKRT